MPPFVGVAVKVAEEPAHIVVAVALFPRVSQWLETTMVMLLLIAVGAVAQLALLVSTQVITSPLARAASNLHYLFPHYYRSFSIGKRAFIPSFVAVAVNVTLFLHKCWSW